MVEFVVEAPGNYVLLDHSIFRATNKGALGILTVEGEENEKIFSGNNVDKAYSVLDASERGFKGMMPKNNSSKKDPSTKAYNPSSKIEREMNSPSQEQTPLEKQLAKGKKVFNSICFSCHQSDGKGIPGTFPPLANSDYLVADIDRAIGIVANGKKGKITVNGQKYNGVMPNFGLTDQEVSDVLTYVLHHFNDNKTIISKERVNKVKNK
jgi:Cytochrome c, mono- and diheme variants